MTDRCESDPHGLDAHTPGAKLDGGKTMAGVMLTGFAHALSDVARVTTHGAQKYTIHGWREVPDAPRRYFDALMRHLLAHAGGERVDPDSGLPHLAHAAWNALAVLELEGRPSPSGSLSLTEVLAMASAAARQRQLRQEMEGK